MTQNQSDWNSIHWLRNRCLHRHRFQLLGCPVACGYRPQTRWALLLPWCSKYQLSLNINLVSTIAEFEIKKKVWDSLYSQRRFWKLSVNVSSDFTDGFWHVWFDFKCKHVSLAPVQVWVVCVCFGWLVFGFFFLLNLFCAYFFSSEVLFSELSYPYIGN